MSPLVMSSAFMAILDGRDRIGRDSRTESCGTPQDVEDGLHMAMPPRIQNGGLYENCVTNSAGDLKSHMPQAYGKFVHGKLDRGFGKVCKYGM